MMGLDESSNVVHDSPPSAANPPLRENTLRGFALCYEFYCLIPHAVQSLRSLDPRGGPSFCLNLYGALNISFNSRIVSLFSCWSWRIFFD